MFTISYKNIEALDKMNDQTCSIEREREMKKSMIDDYYARSTVGWRGKFCRLPEARNANRDHTFKSLRHSPLNGSDLNLAANLKVFLLERRLPACRERKRRPPISSVPTPLSSCAPTGRRRRLPRLPPATVTGLNLASSRSTPYYSR